MDAPYTVPFLPHDIAIRLANEGVPVRAIARAVKVAGEDMYDLLHDAVMEGRLIGIPKDDWPPGSPRANRVPDAPILKDEDTLKYLCAIRFKTTPLENDVFAALLKRQCATKQHLHDAIEHGRMTRGGHKEPTGQKLVDVGIHHLRRKLAPHNILITTDHGAGYHLEPGMRTLAIKLLSELHAD